MALVAITCHNCAGKGNVMSSAGNGDFNHHHWVTCNECEGACTILVHTSAFNVSVDPASNSIDDTTAILWRANDDDGSIEVLDLFEMSQRREPTEDRYGPRPDKRFKYGQPGEPS